MSFGLTSNRQTAIAFTGKGYGGLPIMKALAHQVGPVATRIAGASARITFIRTTDGRQTGFISSERAWLMSLVSACVTIPKDSFRPMALWKVCREVS